MIFTNWISLKMLVDHFLIIARGYFLMDWEKELNVDTFGFLKKVLIFSMILILC
jgi:hypothetical protein